MSGDHFHYAKELLEKAEAHLEEAESAFERLPLGSPSNVISSCQVAVELSAKAVFKFANMDFPEKHSFPFDEDEQTQNLIKKAEAEDFPERFRRGNKIPRVLFLTQFWWHFYQPAKYGEEKLNVSPDELFSKTDAEWALEHAKECVRIAEDLRYATE